MTCTSLTNQQSNAENDVKEMSVLKEVLEKEYNEVKFVGQDEGNSETREQMEEIDLLIEDNKKREKVNHESLLDYQDQTINLSTNQPIMNQSHVTGSTGPDQIHRQETGEHQTVFLWFDRAAGGS